MEQEHYYLGLKSLHILGGILFLGNIIVTACWKIFADKSKDWRIIAFSQRLVTYTDFIFTTTGVCLLAVTGVLMAKFYADFHHVKWIAWGISLFIASGLIWIIILIPVQFKLHNLVNTFSETNAVPPLYWKYEKIWFIFGIIATILPLLNLYWMVFKPV
jgi:uncharacterized membrane protein